MAQLGLRNIYATRDYMTAMRNFSARKTLQIISKIREIDARSKGLDNVNTTSGDLLKELVTFIVS
jgi:DNA polymerase-3 subunit delta